ncbi:hypothetical protein QE152_g38157 [Popillia japonica]|uniref:CCHC-type domain-containing protein n=1 Tax=Popillia japonica TaxID=7064 RepID=A0AAW1I8T0_POPJA
MEKTKTLEINEIKSKQPKQTVNKRFEHRRYGHGNEVRKDRASAGDVHTGNTSMKQQKLDKGTMNRKHLTRRECSRCGNNHAEGARCPAIRRRCNHCGKYNHFIQQCRFKNKNVNNISSIDDEDAVITAASTIILFNNVDLKTKM